MYKILDSDGLGVSGRQNELIELALTYRFNGVEVDMSDLVGRHDTLGKQFACQFLKSAKTEMGTFALPVDLGCSNADYEKFSAKIDTIADLASELGCKRCFVRIAPTSNDSSFQENFERHRTRLHELAEKFSAKDLRIGLYLQAAKAQTSTGDYKFIQSAEEILTLVRTVGHPGVGLCLDTFEWVVGDGAMDQITELDLSTLTEVRLSDVNDAADLKAIKPTDRRLPGDVDGSFSVKLMKHLVDNGFEGPVSVGTNVSTFAGVPRDKVVNNISSRLDRLIANEPIHDPVAETPESEGDGGEAGEAEAAKGDAAEKKEAPATAEPATTDA